MRAKNWRSDFNGGQGREPRRPIPRDGVEATMSVIDRWRVSGDCEEADIL